MDIMSLTEIMDRSIEILKKYIKTIIMFTLGYGIISFFVVIAVILLGTFFSLLIGSVFSSITIGVILGAIFILFGIAYYLTANIGIIKITSQEFLEEKIYAYGAIKYSFKNIFKVFGIVFSIAVTFIPVGVILGGITYFIFEYLDNSMITYNINSMDLSSLGVILLIVLLILVGAFVVLTYFTIFAFSIHVAVIEKKGVIGSLKKSFKLVKNNFWKIYGCIILCNLAVYAIKLSIDGLAGVIVSIVYLVLKFFSVSGDYATFVSAGVTLLKWPMNIVSWLIISPISTIMITLLYFNQRFKKEGYDISLRLKAIEKKSSENNITVL